MRRLKLKCNATSLISMYNTTYTCTFPIRLLKAMGFFLAHEGLLLKTHAKL